MAGLTAEAGLDAAPPAGIEVWRLEILTERRARGCGSSRRSARRGDLDERTEGAGHWLDVALEGTKRQS